MHIMKIDRIEYGTIALLGLETVARNKFGRDEGDLLSIG